jgi:hypothetical protein
MSPLFRGGSAKYEILPFLRQEVELERFCMTKVFISYGRRDRKIAESLCNWLETRGISCWIAPRDIHSGISYAGEITRAIRSALLIVVICSKNASKSEHVKTEINLAFNSSKFILPYCLDDTPFDDDLEYYLSFKQRIPYSGDYDKDFALIEKIILSHRNGTISSGVPDFHPKGHKDHKALYFVIPLLGILVVIAFSRLPVRTDNILPVSEPGDVPHAAIETVVVVEKPVSIREKVVIQKTAVQSTDTLLARINDIMLDSDFLYGSSTMPDLEESVAEATIDLNEQMVRYLGENDFVYIRDAGACPEGMIQRITQTIAPSHFRTIAYISKSRIHQLERMAAEAHESTGKDAVQELLHQLPQAKTLSDIQDLLLAAHTDAPILSGPVTLATRQEYVDGGFLVFYEQASDNIVEIMTPRDSLGVRTNIRSGSATDPMKYPTTPAYWIFLDKPID